MRKLFVLALASLLVSCATAAPKNKIAPEEWIIFNSKTSYFARETGSNSVYLTVRYGAYTYTDKAAETIPIAKSVFKQVAKDLANKNGKPFAVYDVSAFYESAAYNDITGISTVIVSNGIKFSENMDGSDVQKETGEDGDAGFIEKLEKLKEAFDKGLITSQEYVQKKKQMLEEF